MKKLILLTLLVVGTALTVHAGGSHGHGHGGSHHHSHSSVSFHIGAYPYYSSWYSRPYAYYPSYGYSYPAYGYSYGYPGYGYSYGRPNYAVGGALTGAMLGGIIGSANHQGWEGAGIGAAAGLVLGGIAERSARAQERAAYSQPAYIPDVSAINHSPTAPPANQVPAAPRVEPVSSMKSANSLFGR